MEFLFIIIPLVIVGIIVAAIVGSGVSSKCPNCSKWWGLVEKERTEVARSTGSKTITLKDARKDASGKTIEEVERQEVVPTERITYDSRQQCKHCGHETNKQVFVENVLSPPMKKSLSSNVHSPLPGSVEKVRCNLCNGFGSRFQESCPACGGDGSVLVLKPSRKCSNCMGFGKKFNDLCPNCGGTGWSNRVSGT